MVDVVTAFLYIHMKRRTFFHCLALHFFGGMPDIIRLSHGSTTKKT